MIKAISLRKPTSQIKPKAEKMTYCTNPQSADTMNESDFNSVKHQCGYSVMSQVDAEDFYPGEQGSSKVYFKWCE